MTMKVSPVLLILIGAGFEAGAGRQDANVVDRLRRAVVSIESSASGSGFIIAVEADRARVLTARHVVEGQGRRRESERSTARPCAARPDVVFEFDVPVRQTATAAMCSDEEDIALLDVPLRTAPGTVPSFKEARSPLEFPGNHVVFLGRGKAFGDGTIVGNEAASSPTGRLMTSVGLGARPGFSGGPVIDEDGALAGMVLASGNLSTTSLRWGRIAEILGSWGVRPVLQPSAAAADDTFRNKAVQGALNEGARNAVREYRRALVRKDRAALIRLYPDLAPATIDALFGDAITIGLRLRDCDDRNAENRLSCEYQLTVVRRTGSAPPFTSSCFVPCPEPKPDEKRKPGERRLTFALEEDPDTGRWIVKNVTEGALP